jgi:hypothetical protein
MMKKLVASLAVASLVVAQPLAAATRSSESLPSSGVQSAERVGSIAGEAEAVRGKPIFVIALVFGVLTLLLLLSNGGGNGPSDSPG